MDQQKRVRVLYILGGGHSGSTVLSLILGAAPEVFNAGELKFYSKHSDPDFLRWHSVKNQCSCGEEARSCPFWSEVEKKSPDLSIKYQPGFKGYLEAVFSRLIPSTVKYTPNDSVLFRHILQTAQDQNQAARIVLDISKNLPRYLQLQANPELDVSTIFLVRDGRGYINSYRKQHQGRILALLLQWIGLNFIAWLHLIIDKKPFYKLSYDHFTQDPEIFLNEFNEIFNIDIPPNYTQAVNKTTYHLRAGNAAVLGKNFTRLEQDNSWKNELPRGVRWILSIVVTPFNRLFGV